MSDLTERLRRIAHPNSTEGRVALEAVHRIEELEGRVVGALSDVDGAYARVQAASEDVVVDALIDLAYYAGAAAHTIRLAEREAAR